MAYLGILTAAIALYAAALSTFNFWINRRDKSRRLVVELSLGAVAKEDSGFHMSGEKVVLYIANPGLRPVTVTFPVFRLPCGGSLWFPMPDGTTKFPCELSEGKSCMMWINATDFARELIKRGFDGKVKIMAVVKDAVGASFTSPPLVFDTDPKARSSFDNAIIK